MGIKTGHHCMLGFREFVRPLPLPSNCSAIALKMAKLPLKLTYGDWNLKNSLISHHLYSCPLLSPARQGQCACQSWLYFYKQALVCPLSNCRQPHSRRRSQLPPGRNAARGCQGTGCQSWWGRCTLGRQSSLMSRRQACHGPVYWSRLTREEIEESACEEAKQIRSNSNYTKHRK